MSITINFLYGCSNDQYDITEELSLSEAQNLARNHLSIEGEKYVLNLTREEANKMGISTDVYTQFVHEVYEINDFLEDFRMKGHDVKMSLNDTLNLSKIEMKRIKSRSESTQTEGMIILNSNIQKEFSIDIPSGYTKITFTATTTCFIASIVLIHEDTTKAIIGGSGGSTTFDIPMSPYVFNVKINTVCSSGATITYKIS